MRSFKTFLAEQDEFGNRSNKPSPMLQGPGQMPARPGAGGTGSGGPAPRAVRRPLETIRKFGKEAWKSTKKNPLQFPFTLIRPGKGARTGARTLTSLGVAGSGALAVSPILDKDVNEYLQSAGYDPEVRVHPATSAISYAELAVKNPRAAISLATSDPAMKKYVGPAGVSTATALALRNPLAAVIGATPPGIAARRAIVDPAATYFGAKDIQTGENPIAQDAAREYTNIIRRHADAQQKKVDMRRARKQGIRQAINPYYDPNRPKKTGSSNELEGIDLGF